MQANRKSIGWGCFSVWIVACLLGVVAGFTLFYLVMAVLGEGRSVPLYLASLILTICFGTVTGVAQWAILRRYGLRSARWLVDTLLGFLLSSPLLLSLSGGFGPVITARASLIMSAALGGALGIMQWLALRGRTSRSAIWIAISLLSWVIAGLTGMALKSLSWAMSPILYWVGLFFTGTVLSTAGLVWLLGRESQQTGLAAG